MKQALKSLNFPRGKAPSHAEQERVAQALKDILQTAQDIGQARAQEGSTEEGIAWGTGRNPLQSAWNIVTNFVEKIVSWWQGLGDDVEDITDADIEAEIDSEAELVGDFEVHSAIEQAVMDELEAQGVGEMSSIAQPGACERCQTNADESPIPIGDSFPSTGDSVPPYHNRCRCQIVRG